jgi:hypothetical protein
MTYLRPPQFALLKQMMFLMALLAASFAQTPAKRTHGIAASHATGTADAKGPLQREGGVELVDGGAQSAAVPPPLAFRAAIGYFSGGAFADSVAIADLNGDQRPDLLVVNSAESIVSVFIGHGDGKFDAPVPYPSGGAFPNSVAAGDVNGDGVLDILVTNCAATGASSCPGPLGGSVGVLLGNGDGTFQPAVTYETGGLAPWSVALGDLNGDKKLDLIVANRGDSNTTLGSVGVLLGNGDGTFRSAKSYGQGELVSVAVADFNNDGKLDVVATILGGQVDVFLGKGDGTLNAPAFYPSGGQTTWAVAAADLNGDGNVDLAVTNACPVNQCSAQGVVGVLLGKGDGTFQPIVPYPSGSSGAVPLTIADLNGDGKPDIAVGNEGQPNLSFVSVLAGNGDGTFQPAVNFGSAGRNILSVAAGDLNGDGRTDLVAANTCKGSSTSSCQEGGIGVLLKAVFSVQLGLTSSGTSPLVGQPVTFTASISSQFPIPQGRQVMFYDGSNLLGNVTLAGNTASFTTSSLAAKKHSIRVTYAGDYDHTAGSKTISQVVNKYSTTTALQSSPNPSQHGQVVTFAASVRSASPFTLTGRVQFWDGTTLLGAATLAGNTAHFTRSTLATGNHSITAHYLGDANSGNSISPVLIQHVQ